MLASVQSARVNHSPIVTPNAFGDTPQVPDIRVTVSLNYIEAFVDKVMSIATGVKWSVRERMVGVRMDAKNLNDILTTVLLIVMLIGIFSIPILGLIIIFRVAS